MVTIRDEEGFREAELHRGSIQSFTDIARTIIRQDTEGHEGAWLDVASDHATYRVERSPQLQRLLNGLGTCHQVTLGYRVSNEGLTTTVTLHNADDIPFQGGYKWNIPWEVPTDNQILDTCHVGDIVRVEPGLRYAVPDEHKVGEYRLLSILQGSDIKHCVSTNANLEIEIDEQATLHFSTGELKLAPGESASFKTRISVGRFDGWESREREQLARD